MISSCVYAPVRRFLSGGSQKADVVVVGAGIMGLNIAYQLVRRNPNIKVIVLEQASGLGIGSSGYSTGFLRAFYNLDNTMRLALDGIAAYKRWGDYLELNHVTASFQKTDALWMLARHKDFNQSVCSRLRRFGVDAEVLDQHNVKEKFPLISTEAYPKLDDEYNEVEQASIVHVQLTTIHSKFVMKIRLHDVIGAHVTQELPAFSCVFEHGCGYLDPVACLHDLLEACRQKGIAVKFNTRVHEIITNANQVEGVRTNKGEDFIHAPVVVNAAGPWFQKLNDSAGVKLSTTALPIRIQVAHKHVPEQYLNLPFTADMWGDSGIYFIPRRETKQLVFGSLDHKFETEVVNDPDNYNTNLDSDVKQKYLTALLHRLPGLSQSGNVVGFSSMYTVNQDDVHPMVGETQVKGFWVCNGHSGQTHKQLWPHETFGIQVINHKTFDQTIAGHGFKLAPAIGSLVAQQARLNLDGVCAQITHVTLPGALGETTIPWDFLGPYRKPLRELAESDKTVLA